MDEYTTNPTAWSIEGNIVGGELGTLDYLGIFTHSHTTMTDDGTDNIDGSTLNVIKLVYSA